jgi:hypothetical protein
MATVHKDARWSVVNFRQQDYILSREQLISILDVYSLESAVSSRYYVVHCQPSYHRRNAEHLAVGGDDWWLN